MSTRERLLSALTDRRLRCKIVIFTSNFVVFPIESTNETASAVWKVLISALKRRLEASFLSPSGQKYGKFMENCLEEKR